MSQRKMIHIACVLLVLGACLCITPSSPAARATQVSLCGGWSIVKSPNPQSTNILTAVSAVSASDVWAVGYDIFYPNLSVIEHWDGAKWKVVPGPSIRKEESELLAVAAVSTNDVWAVGYSYPPRGAHKTLIEHWNGTKWSIVPSPSPGFFDNDLYGLAAVSANDVWAVGSYTADTSDPTLIEHWNGTNWSVIFSPNVADGNYLTGVVAVSANDIWAVGYYSFLSGGGNQTLIEHWNGRKWSIVSSPNPGVYGNGLSGVSAASASDVWAVGNSTILHWNGTIWSIVQAHVPGSLVGVSVVSANDIWAVGSGINGTLTEHWNGTVWHVVKSPNVKGYSSYLSAVAVVTSSDVWAVGNYNNNDIFYQTLIEHYC